MIDNYGTRKPDFKVSPKSFIYIVIETKIALHESTVDEILLKGW